MKFLALAAILATAIAVPVGISIPEAADSGLELHEVDESIIKRQGVGSTANELENGACRRITLIFARGSTEPGNLGSSVGPATCNALKSTYGAANVACQGVGGPYLATLVANTLPQGTTTAAIGEAQRLFRLAASKCPNTIIVGGGYSQGAAVMVGAVGNLGTAIENRIVGVVLYGNTRNRQENGIIPGYPADDALTICNTGDPVCQGTLIVNAAHLAYIPTVPRASAFLNGKINAA